MDNIKMQKDNKKLIYIFHLKFEKLDKWSSITCNNSALPYTCTITYKKQINDTMKGHIIEWLKWMYEWMNEWMIEWMNKWMNRWMN